MTEISTNTFLEKAEIFATKTVTRSFSNRLVYHNLKYVHRVISGVRKIGAAENLSEKEQENLEMAAWLSQLGYKEFDINKTPEDPRAFFVDCYNCTLKIAEEFMEKLDYPAEDKKMVMDILLFSSPMDSKDSKLANVLQDAISMDWSRPKAKKYIAKLHEELLLTESAAVSKSGWLDKAIEYLNNHVYKTSYGLEYLKPKKSELILKLEKEKKDLTKTENLAIKQELGISEEELKSLKKSLKSVKGRDERGVQTMFRTTSRNHYTLNQMVDRKANIMISVNAIILSLIISGVVGKIDTFCIHNSPFLFMLIAAVVSIIFAIFAIIPTKTHGSFSEEEVRNKKGNLLYFGNYHNMAFRDYEWGILQMLNDSNYLYSSMVRDQYFLGKMISRKHWNIRISLGTFLFGFVLAAISFMIVSSMADFHFGSAHVD